MLVVHVANEMVFPSEHPHAQAALKSWHHVDAFFFLVSVQMALVLVALGALVAVVSADVIREVIFFDVQRERGTGGSFSLNIHDLGHHEVQFSKEYR